MIREADELKLLLKTAVRQFFIKKTPRASTLGVTSITEINEN
jgi:hypothetical protein